MPRLARRREPAASTEYQVLRRHPPHHLQVVPTDKPRQALPPEDAPFGFFITATVRALDKPLGKAGHNFHLVTRLRTRLGEVARARIPRHLHRRDLPHLNGRLRRRARARPDLPRPRAALHLPPRPKTPRRGWPPRRKADVWPAVTATYRRRADRQRSQPTRRSRSRPRALTR